MRTLDCPECGSRMFLRDSRQGRFWGCEKFPECTATHGAHQETGDPLGVPGDLETRRARMRAHEAFDPLWEDSLRMYDSGKGGRGPGFLLRVARSRAYSWLAHRMGMTRDECHIGKFDVFHCELVVAHCQRVEPEDVRAWARQRSMKKKIAKLRKRWGAAQHELGFNGDQDE